MRRMLVRSALVLLLGALLAGVMPSAPAQAHAILIDSSPEIDGTTRPGHVEIRLRYNSRVDRKRSRLILTWPDQSQTTLKIRDEGTEDLLFTSADLPAGHYSLRWQVLAVDGHITRGDVPFSVEATP